MVVLPDVGPREGLDRHRGKLCAQVQLVLREAATGLPFEHDDVHHASAREISPLEASHETAAWTASRFDQLSGGLAGAHDGSDIGAPCADVALGGSHELLLEVSATEVSDHADSGGAHHHDEDHRGASEEEPLLEP